MEAMVFVKQNNEQIETKQMINSSYPTDNVISTKIKLPIWSKFEKKKCLKIDAYPSKAKST